jgi:hypothetical protein
MQWGDGEIRYGKLEGWNGGERRVGEAGRREDAKGDAKRAGEDGKSELLRKRDGRWWGAEWSDEAGRGENWEERQTWFRDMKKPRSGNRVPVARLRSEWALWRPAVIFSGDN